MKFSTIRIFVIPATLCFAIIISLSCTKDSELIATNDNLIESITEPTTTEQVQDATLPQVV